MRLEVKGLEQQAPQIELVFLGHSGQVVEKIDASFGVYDSISEEELDSIIAELRARHPIVEEFLPVPGFGAPDIAQIEEYQELYDKWLVKSRRFFKNLPKVVSSRYVEASLVMSNKGAAPAESLLIEIECAGGLLFNPPESKADQGSVNQILLLPVPGIPRGPKLRRSLSEEFAGLSSQRMFGLSGIPSMPTLNPLPVKRDKNAFYWKPRRPAIESAIWILECDEFRHQVEPEPFLMKILVPDEASGGVVRARVTARNLKTPATLQLPVRVKENRMNIQEKIRMLLDGVPVQV